MQDTDIAARIMRLLAARAPGATLCPSEVARDIAPADWRPLMPAVREIAADMARTGAIEITQRGVVIELDKPVRGPIRLRRSQQNPSSTG